MTMRLSVIIIGKNEEKHLKKCFQSVVKAVSGIKDSEMIYVDSASTDRSVEIAQLFPARILQLKPEWELSAAAGRYIGFLRSEGKYLFFIDGDSFIYRGWLSHAIRFMDENPAVSGVAGVVHEIFLGSDGSVCGFLRNRYGQDDQTVEASTLGGIALYRQHTLEKVGPFNPYIPVDEERELALRIRKDGLKIVRIPEPMAITTGPERETIKEVMRRSRTRLYHFGIPLKYCQRNGMGGQYLKERLGFFVTYMAAVLSGLIVLIVAWIWDFLFPVFLLSIVLLIVPVLLRKKNMRSMINSFLKRTVLSYWTIKSYFQTQIHEISDYPTDVIVHGTKQRNPGGE